MPNTKSESRFSYRESPDDGAARRVERSSQFEALRKKSGASFCPVSPLAVNPSFYVFSKTAQKSFIGNSQTLDGTLGSVSSQSLQCLRDGPCCSNFFARD